MLRRGKGPARAGPVLHQPPVGLCYKTGTDAAIPGRPRRVRPAPTKARARTSAHDRTTQNPAFRARHSAPVFARDARDLRAHAHRPRAVDGAVGGALRRLAADAGARTVVRPRRVDDASGPGPALRGGIAQPLARLAPASRSALRLVRADPVRAAVRRRRRGDLLAGIRHALQFHRGRLPPLHPRGDRQHPRVVPGPVDPGRHRAGGPGDRLRSAGLAPARRCDPPFPPASPGLRDGCGRAAGGRDERGLHRPDGPDRQRLCRRARGQRSLHFRGGDAPQ